MKRVFFAVVFLFTSITSGMAIAQQQYWVQIEANPTLQEAEEANRLYATRLQSVEGYRLTSGWYATVLGPFSQAEAEANYVELRNSGAIPRDSFIADGARFGQQFWPMSSALLNGGAADDAAPVDGDAATQERAQALADAQAEAEGTPAGDLPVIDPTEEAAAEPAPAPEPEPAPLPEETRAEALSSERLLDRPAREALQVALQFDGFYNSAIDGAFGPGTRNAMAAWQVAQGYEGTGVLTTRQREELLGAYNAVFDSLGLETVWDRRAGIEVVMPSEILSFDRYEAPFAHYQGSEGDVPRIVLISQSGDRNTLYGLYDILQTLEVVPPTGPRVRRDMDFTIEGTNSEVHSYTHAVVVDGAVKGYMIVWPTGDERRFNIVLDAMQESFTSAGTAVLDDNAGIDEAVQSIDLISGLEIRRPDRARSGFFVTRDGAVLTASEGIGACERITLNDSYAASVVAQDESLGVALLRPETRLAPISIAQFQTGTPRLNADLSVSGFSYGGRLPAPTLTYGTLAELSGLGGEAELARLEMSPQDGDVGGPVLDGSGTVLGMLLPDSVVQDQQLPEDVAFLVKGSALGGFLTEQGVTTDATEIRTSLAPYDLTLLAENMTVLVSCWE